MRRSSPAALLLPLLFFAVHVLPARADEPLLRLSLEPGLYDRDQVLRVSGRDPDLRLGYAFFNRGAWGAWIPCREPLELPALPGEERDYRLKVAAFPAGAGTVPLEERELAVRIDRRAPSPPDILPLPAAGGPAGMENPELAAFRFRSPEGEAVWFALDSGEPEAGRPWDGKVLEFALPSAPEGDHFLRAWCRDQAGNRSAESFHRFTLTAAPPQLSIASPAPGRFANRQLLVVNSRNLAEVRYTLDGSDPLERGQLYSGPVLLTETGTLRLRVAGRPVSGGAAGGARTLYRETIAHVEPEEPATLSCDAASGLRASGLQVGVSGPAGSRVRFSLSERTPTEADPVVEEPIALESVPLSRREYVLRLRAQDGEGRWGAEYRYFFVMDRVRPPAPLIYWERSPEGTLTVSLRGSEGTRLHYTLDGSLPGEGSPRYTTPLRLELPARRELLIRAVAFGPARQASGTAERRLVFDLQPPDPPQLRLLAVDGGGRPPLPLESGTGEPPVSGRPVLLAVKGPGEGRVIYEVSSSGADPAPLTPSSPVLGADLLLAVPYGLHREFRLRVGSCDDSGNIAAPAGVRTVVLDREPPAPPVLDPPPSGEGFDRPLKVELAAGEPVRFELTRDGSQPPDPGPRSPLLARFLELEGRAGERVEYRVKFRLTDRAGNAGEVCGPYTYPVDLRRPVLPPLSGPENGGSTHQREVGLVPGPSPFRVAFTATEDGSEPPEPQASSPLLGPEVRFTGIPDGEKTIRLKLLPVSPGRNQQGSASAYRFTIDLDPPRTPQIEGFEPGSRYNLPVRVAAKSADPRDRLYVSSSSASWSLPDPVAQGRLYGGEPLLFEPAEGAERTVFLRVAAVDPAGNRALSDRYAGFVLDRLSPEPPEAVVVPDQVLTRERFSVILQAAEGRIRYELTDDGRTPPVPNAGSPVYQSPLLLGGKEGEEVTWKVSAVAEDDLGNASAPTPVTILRVDRRPPPLPPEPGVRVLEEQDRWLVSWQVPAGQRLFYGLKADAGAGQPFQHYEGPAALLQGGDAASGRPSLEYYLEDEAGNRGPTRSSRLPALRPRLAVPGIEGARDGGLYREGVGLRARAAGGQVRYELSMDGMPPDEVTPASPLAPAVMLLDAVDGQTIRFHLRLRAYGEEGAVRPSGETQLRFSVDRTPPAPPVLDGAADRDCFPLPRTVRLLAEEGEVLYSLSEVPEDGRERGTEAPMLRYGGEVLLDAPEGQARCYRLTACTVDRAGNRSRTTPVWLLSVDRQSVYAAPEGDDRADGSRGRPLRSLERAASLAREQGRTRLLLAEGAFPLSGEVLLAGDLRVEGGFAPQTWEKPRFEQRSVLEGTGRFPAGSALLRVRSGSVVLSGLELRDAGRLSGALVEVEGGRLEAYGLRLALSEAPGGASRQALGVLQQGGSLLLQNCELQAEGVRRGALVESTGGDSRLAACRFTGPREADDFVALRLGGTGRHTLDRVQVDPGKGRRTASLRARGTRIEVSESTLRTGAGSELGVSIELEDAVLRVVSSRLAGDPAAAYTVGVRATRSQVHLERTELIAAARFGAAGLFLRAGRTEVSRSTLRGEDSGEYCTLVDAAAGRAVFTNNLLLGPRSGDSLAALLDGVDSEWLHNTLRGGTGRNLTIGLWVEEGSRLRLINNLLFREEGNQGSALRLRRAGTARPAALGGSGEGLGAWEVQANCFSGWGTLLETGGAEPGAPSAERLNGADGDWSGGHFRGNIEEPWPQSLPKADAGDYHLATGSRCVDGGLEAGVRLDLDGQPRPAPYTGGRALPDIGADEVH